MQTIYSFVLSDGATALHFLLTMVLLVAVILSGIRADTVSRRLARENVDLKRQLIELSDYMSSSLHGVRRRVDKQRDAICHTADCMLGASGIEMERFHALHDQSSREESWLPAVADYNVDLNYDELPDPDLSMAESAFVEPASDRHEPDVSMPLKASMTTIPEYRELMSEPIEEMEERTAPDLMTRVLNRSKGR